VTRQTFGVTIVDLRGCYTAAVRASCAVDRAFNLLGDTFETPLDKVVALHPCAKPHVLRTVFLAKPRNLDEISKHHSSISRKIGLKHLTFDLFRTSVGLRPGPDNESVTDQLYLSIWLERHSRRTLSYYFEKLVRIFPFSQREQPQSTISIRAVDSTEPPLLERPVNGPLDIEEVNAIFRDYQGEDICYEVESWWDLWQFVGDWQLRPTRVLLSAFGPEFDNGTERKTIEQEDLRIDFGVDTNYLPQPDIPGSAKLIESNIKSLLRFVHELELSLPVAHRRLETESGGNFAERLQQTLGANLQRQ
jgi:hypothetical protein